VSDSTISDDHSHHLQAALAHLQARQFDDAIDTLNTVLASTPEHSDALHLMGIAHVNAGRISEGVMWLQRALQTDPARLEFALVLVKTLRSVKQPRMICNLILALPVQVRIHPKICVEHAQAHHALGETTQAIAVLKRGLEASPLSVPLLNELGNQSRYNADLNAAEAYLREAIRCGGSDSTTAYNLGNILLLQHRPADAKVAFLDAIASNPNLATAHTHLGLSLLMQGDLENGWAEYEWRWKVPDFPNKQPPIPLWDGQDINGKTLLLTTEQGFGDAFQFAQFIPEVAHHSNAHIVVSAQPQIAELLKSIEGVNDVVPHGSTLPPCNVQAPLMSLPMILQTRLKDLPSTPSPYINTPSQKREAWADTFTNTPGRKIGIVWRGNPSQLNNIFRSCPVDKLTPFLDVSDTTFFILQKDVTETEVEALPGAINLAPHLEDFSDTAAIMSHLDLVISVCTSTAHLSGALGRPTWVMLSAASDWRWFLDRDDSPWYPTARLFRQSQLHDWDGVVSSMVDALETFEPPAK